MGCVPVRIRVCVYVCGCAWVYVGGGRGVTDVEDRFVHINFVFLSVVFV